MYLTLLDFRIKMFATWQSAIVKKPTFFLSNESFIWNERKEIYMGNEKVLQRGIQKIRERKCNFARFFVTLHPK